MKLTRSYSTTPDLEKRIAKLYRRIYGKDSNQNSALHRDLLELGIEAKESELDRKSKSKRRGPLVRKAS